MASFVKGKMIVQCFWISYLCIKISPVWSQTVNFSIRDQSNNRFVFEGETNIELICQYSGFSNVPVLQISNKAAVIAIGSSSLSENYTITVNNDSAILTIKMASESTAGTYKCLVSDQVLRLQESFNLEVLTQSMGPRCWSSVTLENGVVTGQKFYADCFYFDKNDVFDSEWTKVLPNGTETQVTSTEMVLHGKKKRTLNMAAVEDEDDGVLYKCSVSHQTSMLIPSTTCEIGPVYIYQESTVHVSVSSSFTGPVRVSVSSFTSPLLSTTEIPPDKTTLGTTKQFSDTHSVVSSSPSLFDDYGLYIIIAIAVVFLIFILVLVVICLYCHKNSKGGESQKTQTDEENDLSKTSTTELPDHVYLYNTLPAENDGSYYDVPPLGITEDKVVIESAPIASATNKSSEYVNGGFHLDRESNRESFVIPGPDDLVSTHL